MRKILLLLIFCHTCFSSPLHDHKINPLAIQELMEALNINGDIVKETQKYWLRSSGKELWEINEINSDQKSLVLSWVKKHNFLNEWEPIDSIYDVALILGATTPRMETRLEYLKKLWNQGIRFNQIVWLTGERPLDKKIDSLTDICTTELEAAQKLWQKADLPTDMKNLPVTYTASKMKVNGQILLRPNTKDTLITWLETQKMPCKALFVSNQPFCGYQFAVINSVLPQTFSFDVVGPGYNLEKNKSSAAVILDSLARWIYQENCE